MAKQLAGDAHVLEVAQHVLEFLQPPALRFEQLAIGRTEELEKVTQPLALDTQRMQRLITNSESDVISRPRRSTPR